MGWKLVSGTKISRFTPNLHGVQTMSVRLLSVRRERARGASNWIIYTLRLVRCAGPGSIPGCKTFPTMIYTTRRGLGAIPGEWKFIRISIDFEISTTSDHGFVDAQGSKSECLSGKMEENLQQEKEGQNKFSFWFGFPSIARRKGVRRLLWPYAGSRKLSFDNGNGQGFTAARNRTGVLEGSWLIKF